MAGAIRVTVSVAILIAALWGALTLTGVFVSGASSSAASATDRMVEPRYRLSDCTALLNMEWSEGVTLAEKLQIIDAADEELIRVANSQEFPVFAWHSTREMDHYVFYFADQCESRAKIVNDIVAQYLRLRIGSRFPETTVVVDSYKSDLDGVAPSGWWIDQ